MPFTIYPIILIVAVIIFYILGKKNGTKEVIKTVIDNQPANDEVNTYADETEEEYLLRCHNFIIDFLNKKDIKYHISTDHKSFKSTFEDNDGTIFNVNIDIFYSGGDKLILFHTRVNDRSVPDDKLSKVSELVNRLNDALLINTLCLNYEYRSIESTMFYKVGDLPLAEEYFRFHYSIVVRSRNNRAAFSRVIDDNEEPALIAIDYLSQ